MMKEHIEEGRWPLVAPLLLIIDIFLSKTTHFTAIIFLFCIALNKPKMSWTFSPYLVHTFFSSLKMFPRFQFLYWILDFVVLHKESNEFVKSCQILNPEWKSNCSHSWLPAQSFSWGGKQLGLLAKKWKHSQIQFFFDNFAEKWGNPLLGCMQLAPPAKEIFNVVTCRRNKPENLSDIPQPSMKSYDLWQSSRHVEMHLLHFTRQHSRERDKGKVTSCGKVLGIITFYKTTNARGKFVPWRASKVFIQSHLTLLQGKTCGQTEPLNCTFQDLLIQILLSWTEEEKLQIYPLYFGLKTKPPWRWNMFWWCCYFLIKLDNHICCFLQSIKVFWK